MSIYSLKHLGELLKDIKVEGGCEDLPPLEPLGTAADQKSLAHKGLQEVIEDALVRVLSRRKDNLNEISNLSPNCRSLIGPKTHLSFLCPNNVQMKYTKGVVPIRLLVGFRKAPQVHERILQVQGQHKLQIVPKGANSRATHFLCHRVHGASSQEYFYQYGKGPKDTAQDGHEIETPPHLDGTKVYRSLRRKLVSFDHSCECSFCCTRSTAHSTQNQGELQSNERTW